MIFTPTTLVLALATGFAAAGPIQSRPRQSSFDASKFQGANGFNFPGALNQFNDVQQIVQIKEQNLQIVDNGVQQAVIAQAQEVLIIDQQNARFNDLFRQSNYRNKFNDVTTVVMVVQQIQIAVDDGRGNVFQQEIFAQSAVVANRGASSTQTVLVQDERQLIATQVLDGFGGRGAQATGAAFQNNSNQRINDVALFNDKPVWSVEEKDPAAILGVQWQAELEALLDDKSVDFQNEEELKVLAALKAE
jgi:hypothetical protein